MMLLFSGNFMISFLNICVSCKLLFQFCNVPAIIIVVVIVIYFFNCEFLLILLFISGTPTIKNAGYPCLTLWFFHIPLPPTSHFFCFWWFPWFNLLLLFFKFLWTFNFVIVLILWCPVLDRYSILTIFCWSLSHFA